MPKSFFEHLLSASGYSPLPSPWARSLAGVVPWETPGLQLLTSTGDQTYRSHMSHAINKQRMAGGCGLSVVYSPIYGASQKWATHTGNFLYMGGREGEKKRKINQELLVAT